MKKLQATLLLLCLIFFSGCEKGYLDEPKPTESVNSSVIFESADGAKASCQVFLEQVEANLLGQTPEVYTPCILPELLKVMT